MPYWTEITTEIDNASQTEGIAALDSIRRKYLLKLSEKTGRDTILYATGFTQQSPSDSHSINFEDIHGLMAVMPTLQRKELDLIIHSPGGLAEAANAIVDYLRSRFENIRVIVPNFAFSAAAMLACAGDEIVMGKHSFLGPIDPQIILPTSLGTRTMAAQAIIQQFDYVISTVIRQPALLALLNQYGPDLLITCQNASLLSRELVYKWLKNYMFAKDTDAEEHAKQVAEWLGNHSNFKSHGLTISREELAKFKVNVSNLEDDDYVQDLVLSVFHAASYLFNVAGVAKIIENQNGYCYMKILPASPGNDQVIATPPQPQQPTAPEAPQSP